MKNTYTNFILNIKEKIYLLFKILLIFIIFYRIKKTNYIYNDNINLSKFINNNNFLMYKINQNNFNLLLNEKNTKIENLFFLIEIIPFIQKKIIINGNKNKEIFLLCKKIFKNKKKTKNLISLNKNDHYYLVKVFKEIIYYKWEIIPKINSINYLRYIVNNFYNEICLDIFDKALNFNLKIYIKVNKKDFSLKEINSLMSKY